MPWTVHAIDHENLNFPLYKTQIIQAEPTESKSTRDSHSLLRVAVALFSLSVCLSLSLSLSSKKDNTHERTPCSAVLLVD